MLGLCDEVAGDISCVAAFAGDHNLGWSGEYIDCTVKSYQALGGGDVKIAGADYFVYALEISTIGQYGDGVRTTQAIELRYAEQVGCGESPARVWARPPRCAPLPLPQEWQS